MWLSVYLSFSQASHTPPVLLFVPLEVFVLPSCIQAASNWVHPALPAASPWGRCSDKAEERPIDPGLLRLHSKSVVEKQWRKSLPAGGAWLSNPCHSPALGQFLLLVHQMCAASDANPLAQCAPSTSLQRAVGTLLELMPCTCCSTPQCPTTSQAHDSMCHWIPHSQRNTPGLQQAGHRDMEPRFFLLLHQATTLSSLDPE